VNAERDLLCQTVAALVDRHAGPEAVRRAMESDRGYDESLWQLLCEQVGAAALVVPEEFGGAAGELADAAAVVEMLGRGLVPSPLLGTILAELALLAADDPDTAAIEALAAGESVGALVTDRDHVIHGDAADVVVAVEEGRLVRWRDVTAQPLTPLDPTRRLARLTPGTTEVIGQDPGLTDTATILLAAEQVGAAARCLDLTVDYTRQRVQFGRPIGSFQALKHRMADMYVAVEAARAVVGDAVAHPSPTTAALAGLTANEAFRAVAGEAVQLHGGIAITWEYDIQLYFKRAYSCAQLFGTPADALRRLQSEVL
jgi:alkylation response protein AidB-like acyl-CoA dehydrogenase